MTTVQACEQYINGNIKDAKRLLRNTDGLKIAEIFSNVFGYSMNKALLTAGHIKGLNSFQSACDAE